MQAESHSESMGFKSNLFRRQFDGVHLGMLPPCEHLPTPKGFEEVCNIILHSFSWSEPLDSLEKPTWMMGLNHCVNDRMQLRSSQYAKPLVVHI